MDRLIDPGVGLVRRVMDEVAKVLNKLTFGKLTPNMVTLISLLGHVLVAYLIATRHPLWAGGFLVIFGLMDALDGALARLQNKVSNAGMLFDAVSDRVKEILLYSAIAYFFIELNYPFYAVWAAGALGASLLVSYVKAKGETVLKDTNLEPSEINRVFASGLARFEIRIALIIVGLFTALLPEMMVIILVLSALTALSRLVKIVRYVKG